MQLYLYAACEVQVLCYCFLEVQSLNNVPYRIAEKCHVQCQRLCIGTCRFKYNPSQKSEEINFKKNCLRIPCLGDFEQRSEARVVVAEAVQSCATFDDDIH